jgi:hypothetical protein
MWEIQFTSTVLTTRNRIHINIEVPQKPDTFYRNSYSSFTFKMEEKRCGVRDTHTLMHTYTHNILFLFQTGLSVCHFIVFQSSMLQIQTIWIRGYITSSASYLMYINKNTINTTELVGIELHFGFNNISRLCHNWCQQSGNETTWETYRRCEVWVKPFWKKGIQGTELYTRWWTDITRILLWTCCQVSSCKWKFTYFLTLPFMLNPHWQY